MNEPLVLTFDIGTQSIRAALVKRDGSFLAFTQKHYAAPYFSTSPLFAEQTPDFYFEMLCSVSKKLLSENENYLKNITAVCVTTLRDSVLCLDKEMQPLRNIILWTDKRKARFTKPFGIIRSALFSAVGMYKTAKMQYINSACNWLMQNESELWEKTDKFVYLSAYINYKLTGNLCDSTASAIGHMPFNYKKGKWYKGKSLTRPVYDIPFSKLCNLINPGEKLGRITEKVSLLTLIPKGLPLIAAGSDKGCETLGLGVISPDTAAVSLGTTASVQITSRKYISPKAFVPAFPAVIKNIYNAEVQIYSGFRLISLFMEYFSDKNNISYEEFNSYLKLIPAGSDGLNVYPYWTADILKPDATGEITGITDAHTPFHLYKAIIEGIIFELKSGIIRLEKRSGIKIRKVFLSGGGAKSEGVCQLCADIFERPVIKIQTEQTSSLGAAILAFTATGEFKNINDAIKTMSHPKEIFYPAVSKMEEYEKIYKKRKK